MIARRAAAATVLLLAGAAQAAPVPFIGCPSDGQQGPQPAPRTGATPDVPAHAAPKLAWYAVSDGTGVLAPRGWHCVGAIGSNGETIIAAPGKLDGRTVTDRAGITGPAVQRSISSGSTSGRFAVARVAARLFPAAHAYVDRVEAEGLDKPYSRGPYPTDRITHRGPYEALFTTPAGRQGLGTASHLAAGPLPIDGIAILRPQADMDLDMLTARLPPAQRPLVAAIVADVAKRK